MDVREGRELDMGRFYGESEVVSRSELDPGHRVMDADEVLVGRNNTRRSWGGGEAKQNIEDPLPVAGDKLVCLRADRKKAKTTADSGG